MRIVIHAKEETEHLVPRDEVDKFIKDNVPAGVYFTIDGQSFAEPARTYLSPNS